MSTLKAAPKSSDDSSDGRETILLISSAQGKRIPADSAKYEAAYRKLIGKGFKTLRPQ